MASNKVSFRKRVLIILTLSGLIELLLLVAAGYMYVKYTQEEELGLKALGVSTFLSQSPYVVNMAKSGVVTTQDQERYRNLTHLIDAAFISIGDQDGIRLIHPIDERIGKPMVGGDNYRALVGGESYTSVATGSLGKSIRGKSAIRDDDGTIIGVVSVGYLVSNLQHRIKPFLIFLITVTLLVVVINVAAASYLSRRYQKSFLGFEPEEIGRLHAELDVVLSTMNDAAITIDNNGIICSINQPACSILGIEKHQAINSLMTDLVPDSDLYTILETGATNQVVEISLNNNKIVANRSAITLEGKVVGAVSIFRLREHALERLDV